MAVMRKLPVVLFCRTRRACRRIPKHLTLPPSCFLKGGAYRDRHETWEAGTMDAAAGETNAPLADGEVVWS